MAAASERDEPRLSVGQVAKRADVAVSTLHFYETKGLIRSWRNAGNQRRYKKDVLRRIAVIKAGQKMGNSLVEIKETLAKLPESRTPTKEDWARMSRFWQAQLDEKIAYMMRVREMVDGCIGCGCLSMKSCPMYNPEDIVATEANGAVWLDHPEQAKAAKNCYDSKN
ncbi:transcriptional regulator [Pseudoalteromonas luteoviolacea CPMOR-2]|uniref:Redox-sensitive transcriptional activator SoxR n=1 Tax=Pseudoalteromonas luteoviolacea DSM 6061 TaxID=1365250 RepID=A0A166V830_9GAMM|nr:redox-sensitive transcriptional activator SoxR [Pseudoalteromonas luteoviolacea]KZN31821.1 transcriptional regulator [Pseudoalteromonas luteoviolacea DSM 6061]KZN52794.1 transcriptional regulator [Pseudoalteromonas luteoviolacea CPMOR-2]MBE0389750.1 MerR family transcriptional regulator, redox-sensitive transcriptional activator SoxR [Pseudoalteromonas luteoviolacea DSM 6061]